MKQVKGPILVTGGCGFIGSALVHALMSQGRDVHVLDAITYAADRGHLPHDFPIHQLYEGRVQDASFVKRVLDSVRPTEIIHAAAETHVDRSIRDPRIFLESNILGTFCILQAALQYWYALPPQAQTNFRFLHVSTDEVYGSIDPPRSFDEHSPYAPNSPYAASKASSDHFVRAWHQTYGFPACITHCTNNFGPRQHPEKLIPTILRHALRNEPIPIYGDGEQKRDWLYVEDHAHALLKLLEHKERSAETYALSSGKNEWTNLSLAREICQRLDQWMPTTRPRARLLTHVTDRAGHDRRYALSSAKYEQMFGPVSRDSFQNQLEATLKWYLNNQTYLFRTTRNHGEINV